MRSIDEQTRAGLAAAVSGVREQVWKRSSVTNRTDEVILDIDASLHQVHSENKEDTAVYYKGFGFCPLYVFSDATGECLAVKLRPGDAAANTVSDHVEVLDQAIEALPAHIRIGHGRGDSPDLVERAMRVRTESAGAPPRRSVSAKTCQAGSSHQHRYRVVPHGNPVTQPQLGVHPPRSVGAA